uniref:Uncharacterized protein n=1 Tax=Oryza glumipatula TaxID=40148 RepID=A0A0E0B4K6_9ORYZ
MASTSRATSGGSFWRSANKGSSSSPSPPPSAWEESIGTCDSGNGLCVNRDTAMTTMTAAADDDDSRGGWWPRHWWRARGRRALQFAPGRCAQVAALLVGGRQREEGLDYEWWWDPPLASGGSWLHLVSRRSNLASESGWRVCWSLFFLYID